MFQIILEYSKSSKESIAEEYYDVMSAIYLDENYHKEKFIKKGILLLGNESNGIRPNLNKFIDRKISIYGDGKAESLNIAISSALILDKIINSKK